MNILKLVDFVPAGQVCSSMRYKIAYNWRGKLMATWRMRKILMTRKVPDPWGKLRVIMLFVSDPKKRYPVIPTNKNNEVAKMKPFQVMRVSVFFDEKI